MSRVWCSAFVCFFLLSDPVFAQNVSINLGDDGSLTTRSVQLLVLITVVALSLLAAAWTVQQIIRPLSGLIRAAEQIASGDYQQRVYVGRTDEFGKLASALNQMSDDLDTRVAELRETGHRLAAVLRGMSEGVIAVDPEQNILFANAAAGNLFRFDANNAQGKQLLQTVRNHQLHEVVEKTLLSGLQRVVE